MTDVDDPGRWSRTLAGVDEVEELASDERCGEDVSQSSSASYLSGARTP
jgi:hypothetical protein